MVRLIFLCCVLAGDDAKPKAGPSGAQPVYELAAQRAGKDPAAHVRLALWCETRGLTAERVRHLALAITYDPQNVLARGLAGLVSYRGTWQRADEVEQTAKSDPARAKIIGEYLERRARTPHTADAQLKLAAWCSEHGLKEQALAHYTEVTRIDPSRETAWKHLGYTKNKKANRWMKPADAAGERLEAERQKRADQQWKPRLEKLRGELESSSSIRRDKARAGLAEVTDPRAVATVMKVFGTGGEPMQLVAVQVLAQIEGPAASLALAVLAIDSPAATVRARAADALSHRDTRDVLAWLIYRVHKPFKYKIKPAQGPGTTAELFVDGEKFDIRRLYRLPNMDVRLGPPIRVVGPGVRDYFPGVDGSGSISPSAMPVLAEFGAYLGAVQQLLLARGAQVTRERDLATQQEMDNDIQLLDDVNAQFAETNDRVLPVLQTLTGQDYGPDPQVWESWWANELGFAVDSGSASDKPTYTDEFALPDVSVPLPVSLLPTSCFSAGTLVHSIDGPRAIELLQVGDLVLSQNTATGALAFQPVVAVHVNKPQPTLKIAINNQSIVATGIHRFWKVSTGWTMARDLKAGDRVRIVGGVATVESIEADKIQRVYNLEVAENRNFCVGKAGVLVHDFSFVQPVLAPFDRVSEPATMNGIAEP